MYFSKKYILGTSLVVQGLRLPLSMKGVRVQSLVGGGNIRYKTEAIL